MTNYPLISEETGKFFDDWGFIVHEKEDQDGGYYGWERWQLNAVKINGRMSKDKNRIWTVIESGDCACMWIVAGERHVNVVHFMVSTLPWKDETIEWLDYYCPECREEDLRCRKALEKLEEE